MSALIKSDELLESKNIINHDIMNCTAEGVVGNHLYSGRALGISQPWDLIQIHPDLEPFWSDICGHYKRVGLSFSENVIWDLDLKQLGGHIGYQPSVFYFGPNECQYWGDRDWLHTVEFINSKNNFMALANDLGVDVPQTQCFDSVKDIDRNVLLHTVFPCYLKAAISVSGVGIYRCDDMSALESAMTKFAMDVPVQIQEEVITDSFLNLQYKVIGNEVVRFGASEQVLDGFVHQGNKVPASYEPWESVDKMAYWLKDHGIKGIFAFDVAVVQTNRGLRFPAIECNPRFNGASYPTMIANKLNINEWSTASLTTQYTKLSDIDISDLEFESKTGEGLIIINWGTILEGKLMVLYAGSKEYRDALAVELACRL